MGNPAKILPASMGNKEAISEAFDKAAMTYDRHAQFQRDVGHRLLDYLPQDLTGKTVLDLGCGTGYFAKIFQQRGANVVCVDMAPKMLEFARERCGDKGMQYLVMDAERLSLNDETIDYVFSSLALQWCSDLSYPFQHIRRVLKPNGKALFSTLLKGSLFELSRAWSKVDEYQHVNDFVSNIQVKIALAQAQCDRYHLDFPIMTIWYPSAFSLMHDLKGIGANHVVGRSQGLTGRSALLAVEKAYKEFESSDGRVPATYHVCLGVIHR